MAERRLHTFESVQVPGYRTRSKASETFSQHRLDSGTLARSNHELILGSIIRGLQNAQNCEPSVTILYSGMQNGPHVDALILSILGSWAMILGTLEVKDASNAHLTLGQEPLLRNTVEARKLESDCPPTPKPREEGKPA